MADFDEGAVGLDPRTLCILAEALDEVWLWKRAEQRPQPGRPLRIELITKIENTAESHHARNVTPTGSSIPPYYQ